MSKEIHGKESLKDGSGPEGWKNPSPWNQASKKPDDWVIPGTNISKEHKFKPSAYYDDTMVKDTSASSDPEPANSFGASSSGKSDSDRFHQEKGSVYRASWQTAHPARKYMDQGADGKPAPSGAVRKPKSNRPQHNQRGKGPTIDPETGDFVYK